MVPSHCVLHYMLIRQGSPHLELHKDTPLWHNVQICQERFGMEKAWVQLRLWDGFPLCVLFTYLTALLWWLNH